MPDQFFMLFWPINHARLHSRHHGNIRIPAGRRFSSIISNQNKHHNQDRSHQNHPDHGDPSFAPVADMPALKCHTPSKKIKYIKTNG